jgi:3-methyladenine DNA glycosylase AlkC
MAEPFKNFINEALVRATGRHLELHATDFDRRRFEALALRGLSELELKARAMQVCDALEATLPGDFDVASRILEASLAPAAAGEDLSSLRTGDEGLAGWALWPMGEFVARRGLESPERALQALHALTQRFTAEWAIRPFIDRHPALTFATLHTWLRDPSPHVRRLVSEGSRPRLPWGLQLRDLIADPSPSLPLLAALQDDASPYVRRSVANHLNDIAKDHPVLVAQWLETHLPSAPAARIALLRHASRTLIKRGDARVLAAWGVGGRFKGEVEFKLGPRRVSLGGAIELTLTLHSRAKAAQRLVIDYAVHHVKANGSLAPKVFKGWSCILGAGATQVLRKRHALRPITTRTYHAGRHEIDVRINGSIVAESHFTLTL